MQEQGTIGLEWPDELPLVGVPVAAAAEGETEEEGSGEASRALSYWIDHALRFGKVSGLDDLLVQVFSYQQYKPFNALILLLQRPGVSYVLPAHRWEETYRRRIRPNEQPLLALIRGGATSVSALDLGRRARLSCIQPIG